MAEVAPISPRALRPTVTLLAKAKKSPVADALTYTMADERRAYLSEHNIDGVLRAAVNRVLHERPEDPVAAIGRLLIKPKAGFIDNFFAGKA